MLEREMAECTLLYRWYPIHFHWRSSLQLSKLRNQQRNMLSAEIWIFFRDLDFASCCPFCYGGLCRTCHCLLQQWWLIIIQPQILITLYVNNPKCSYCFCHVKCCQCFQWKMLLMYRVFFLTGPTPKVLSVRLHSKSHQKSSKCQNLVTEKKTCDF